MPHKAGFVNIIGNPNVGKSTLMNRFIGEKLSIITSKSQTTRHRILGILDKDNYQIVFSDTPGILDPKYKLQEKMLNEVHEAFADADIIIMLVSLEDDVSIKAQIIEKLKILNIPVLFVVNKLDLDDKEKISAWKRYIEGLIPDAKLFFISALHDLYIENLLDHIIALLPENPPYYPKETLTDRNERFFVSEIIREKILLLYQKEVPYSVDIQIEEFKEKADINNIKAFIYVEKESQKGIIIGDKGKAIKTLGIESRKDIEAFLNKKAYLELVVKVKKNWRSKDDALRHFGYS